MPANYPPPQSKPSPVIIDKLKTMNTDIILGIVRHVLTGLGGALVAKGVIGATMLEPTVGAVMTIIGVLWSIYSKKAI